MSLSSGGPMLAVKLTRKNKPDHKLEDLPYPLYGSPKIDGWRGLVDRGRLYSRTLTQIPNRYTQELFCGLPQGMDGELVVGPANGLNVMQATQSGMSTHEGEPDVTFHVFDNFANPQYPYWRRLELIQEWYVKHLFGEIPHVHIVHQQLLHSPQEVQEYEVTQLRLGYEGICLRTPTSKYKFGRSTFREAYLVKIKRYEDGEAIIIGFEEKLHNSNDATTDARGYTKRSSHAENLIPVGTLGSLVCRDLESNAVFNVGTGFTDAERLRIWTRREEFSGLCITYKHFAVTGVKEAPRQPVFKCFRDLRDF